MSMIKEIKSGHILSGSTPYYIGAIGSDLNRVQRWIGVLCTGENVKVYDETMIMFANGTLVRIFSKEEYVRWKKFDIVICDRCSDPILIKTVKDTIDSSDKRFINFKVDVKEEIGLWTK